MILEYLRARYYNADMGRFFQEDTYLGDVLSPLSLNRYAYVKNSPLNYRDPSGRNEDSLETLRNYMKYEPVEGHLPDETQIELMGSKAYDDWSARYAKASTNEERWQLIFEMEAITRVTSLMKDVYQQLSDALLRGMDEAEAASQFAKCGSDNSIAGALGNINWQRVGKGMLGAVAAAAVIATGIGALAAVGSVAAASAVGFMTTGFISTQGMWAVGIALGGSLSYTMGAGDMLYSLDEIIKSLQGSDEAASHVIIDNIEFLRDDPELYYLLEAAVTLGTSEGLRVYNQLWPDLDLTEEDIPKKIKEDAEKKNEIEGESGAKETELFLPDEAYNKQLPKFVTSGTKKLPKYEV